MNSLARAEQTARELNTEAHAALLDMMKPHSRRGDALSHAEIRFLKAADCITPKGHGWRITTHGELTGHALRKLLAAEKQENLV